MPYRKNQFKVTVPHSSGFDKSHRYSGSGTCGTLIPVLCDEVIPGTKVRLKVPMSCQLPPLASETYMNASIKYEAFFVPSRLLCRSFESFFNDFPERVQYGSNGAASDWYDVKGLLPVFSMPITGSNFAPGSLMDYLGFVSTPSPSTPSSPVTFSPMPLVAYHLIWQEWYRNPRVQNPAFTKSLSLRYATGSRGVSIIPDTFFNDATSSFLSNYLFDNTSNFNLADGTSIFSLRQRNFGLDYFTGARVSAQQGSPSGVSISIPAGTDAAGGTTTMTIAALRAANSLQQFRERNNLASPRFVDQIQDRYGVRPSDGVAQRPICIGSATYDISTRGVDQTATDNVGTSSNPFSSVAAQYGRGSALGNDFLIENFEALEPGYIMVMQSLVPEVTYTVGIEKHFQRYLGPDTIVEMANPLLQNVGDQPIFAREVTGYGAVNPGNVFGYTDRFAEFMFRKNSVHGAMRSDAGIGATLKSFILQRDFTGASNVSLSSAFLEIPKNYLDQVFAISSEAAGLSYWFDLYFDYKVTMPIAEFSIPSLQDPAYEHGRTISIKRNGQIF